MARFRFFFFCLLLFYTRLQNRLLRVRGWGTLFKCCRGVRMRRDCAAHLVGSGEQREGEHPVLLLASLLGFHHLISLRLIIDHCLSTLRRLSLKLWPPYCGWRLRRQHHSHACLSLSQCDLRSCETNTYTRNTRQGVLALISLYIT